MSGKVSRGLLAASVLLSLAATPTVHAVSDDVALQLLERLGELEKEVSNLRGENETLRNELQGGQSAQADQDDYSDQDDQYRDSAAEKTDPVPVVPPLMATDVSEFPALEDPLIPVTPPVTGDVSDDTTLSDAEDRKAVAPAVEFNVNSTVKKAVKVDPQSPESYYYYGTDDRNQPDGARLSGTSLKSSKTMATGDLEAEAEAEADARPAVNEIPDEHKAKAEYNQAYKALVNDPVTAVPAFRAFLSKYPDHELAANAQYWLGEALYAQKDYSGATEEFMVVLKQHKKSSKAPGAALKLGYSFYELRQWDFARRTLEDTVRFFPDSNAAILAQQRLEKMTAEGH
jgi:tol-pal system protein YbgF